MLRITSVVVLTAVSLLANKPTLAHVIAGVRVFPVTLTLDDPGVSGEATLPQFVYEPSSGGEHQSISDGNG
jgi:hypothetical protein